MLLVSKFIAIICQMITLILIMQILTKKVTIKFKKAYDDPKHSSLLLAGNNSPPCPFSLDLFLTQCLTISQ